MNRIKYSIRNIMLGGEALIPRGIFALERWNEPTAVLWLALMGAIVGVVSQLNNMCAGGDGISLYPQAMILAGLVSHGLLYMIIFPASQWLLLRRAQKLMTREVYERFKKGQHKSYAIFLGCLLGAFGLDDGDFLWTLLILGFIALNLYLFYRALDASTKARWSTSQEWAACLFTISGAAALIYQIVWQRTLLAVVGLNIESVTIIVTIFMFGLGVGALVGGRIATIYQQRLPEMFLSIEVVIGLFGLISLPMMNALGAVTTHAPLLVTALVVAAMLCLPTLLMGMTLPILTTFMYENYQNLKKTVGLLYFLNTLGSAAACFVTVNVIFVLGGQLSAAIVAALANFTVGALVYRYTRNLRHNVQGTL